MRSKRHRHTHRDGADIDARRRAEATTLYNALVVSQTRAHAISLIDRALLLAHIAGANACVLETSRRRRRHTARTAAGRRRSAAAHG